MSLLFIIVIAVVVVIVVAVVIVVVVIVIAVGVVVISVVGVVVVAVDVRTQARFETLRVHLSFYFLQLLLGSNTPDLPPLCSRFEEKKLPIQFFLRRE